ncbi:hypothetical protein XENOCAPTIV_017838 [Xenoophorus captivus]|uniref:Secreted protein n=1 Tax=Xenoophorus captivus TaxID=1517983 RepID=A0ABV0S0V0_9TELE
MPSSWIFFLYSLPLCILHVLREERGGRWEGGSKGSSLRVCRLASFMSCDHGCPSLHCICVQIRGEESQDVSVLAIMCIKVCEYTNADTSNAKLTATHTHTYTHFHEPENGNMVCVCSTQAGVNSI